MPRQHGEGGRIAGPQHQGDVYRRQAPGGGGQQHHAEGGQQGGQHQPTQALPAAVAEALQGGRLVGEAFLSQQAIDHPQHKGALFQGHRQAKPDAVPVNRRRQKRQLLPEPAPFGEQQQRRRRQGEMGHRQQQRQTGSQPPPAGRRPEGGDDGQGDQQRAADGQQRGDERGGQRLAQLRVGEQRPPVGRGARSAHQFPGGGEQRQIDRRHRPPGQQDQWVP